uniref:Uncharacterized protein n=1 Tax=Ditylenchus dipsaci TaxID=166011 RepID=A0A915EP45_9BILA
MFAILAASLMLVTPGLMLPLVIILCNRRTRKMDIVSEHDFGKNNSKGLVSDFTQTSLGRIPISSKREDSTQSSGRNVPKSSELKSKGAKKHSLRAAQPPEANDQHKLEAERRERRKQQALKQRESRQNYYRQIHNRASENTLFEVRNEEMPEIDLVPQYYAKKSCSRPATALRSPALKWTNFG